MKARGSSQPTTKPLNKASSSERPKSRSCRKWTTRWKSARKRTPQKELSSRRKSSLSSRSRPPSKKNLGDTPGRKVKASNSLLEYRNKMIISFFIYNKRPNYQQLVRNGILKHRRAKQIISSTREQNKYIEIAKLCGRYS